jgi:hypothetical protein
MVLIGVNVPYWRTKAHELAHSQTLKRAEREKFRDGISWNIRTVKAHELTKLISSCLALQSYGGECFRESKTESARERESIRKDT